MSHPANDPAALERARLLLCGLGRAVLAKLLASRSTPPASDPAAVASVTAADTIYAIDRDTEAVIEAWLAASWPREWPVELVMEGLEDGGVTTYPHGTPVGDTLWKLILDPIDGTRMIMYDKRAAWSLAGLAPQRGPGTHLGDLVVSCMTELPTSKQWRADQVSGWRAPGGPSRLVAEGIDTFSGTHRPLAPRPSQADDFRHGFAGVALFFPEARSITAAFEEDLWRALGHHGASGSPIIFSDQYLATGGQVHELLCGHDRMAGDLRPLALPKAGQAASLVCHPYDISTSFLLELAGGVVVAPDGSPLRVPLDTTSPVAWLGFANRRLADRVLPLLPGLLAKHFGPLP